MEVGLNLFEEEITSLGMTENVEGKYPDMPLFCLLCPFSSQVCLSSALVEDGLSGAAKSV